MTVEVAEIAAIVVMTAEDAAIAEAVVPAAPTSLPTNPAARSCPSRTSSSQASSDSTGICASCVIRPYMVESLQEA